MSTLRELIQAKIDAAEAEATTLKAELASMEETGKTWLETEVAAVKDALASYVAFITKHIP